MGFASSWLGERTLFPRLIDEAPDADAGIIVVIPAFNEPEITALLDSLLKCSMPGCGVELIIIVNAPEDAGKEARDNNQKCLKNIEEWKRENSECSFRIHPVDVTPLIHGEWSVGMARKAGMDEAVRRFDSLDRPDGIILSLDADCRVASNYFTAVFEEMHLRPDRQACSIYFEHPVNGVGFPEAIYKAIILYELHLRYYFQALLFTGKPDVHHTVGSAIAVKALPYVKSGGMNRRKAGEDFYFIQKLIPAGGFFSLYGTTVYPSPRTSSRVPFGTGVTVAKLAESENPVLYTYNFKAFRELKILFSLVEKLQSGRPDDFRNVYQDLPPGLRSFINISEWMEKVAEIRKNTSGPESFRKRFFIWFNMFRIVKYLNAVHVSMFEKRPVVESVSELLAETGRHPDTDDALALLQYLRKTERGY
ncbi:MAG TPA: glycosyltransferase family A protein [Bacteroidales bacterium]|jgi:glycosyltransferase involved in cell wall biosynthesis|nr:glycosyltransferase family A protein [Bacteroidales bacterium]